jgi:uncharacterized protein YdaU (DUF1376 family)
MGKAPAFQMYAQDFDMDTAAWSNDEVGIYVRLLNYEWVNGGLPNDIQDLARIAREKKIKFEQKWIKNVSRKFQENGHGMLINRRMEEVRQNQLKYSESQSKKGKASAKKRWDGHITTVKTRLQPEDNSSSSSSSSSLIQKKIYKRKVLLPDEDWIKELQETECYSHLNIKEQLQKCITWFKAKGITVSRQRFLNWLNNPRYNSKPLDSQQGPPTDPMDRRMWEIEEMRKNDGRI